MRKRRATKMVEQKDFELTSSYKHTSHNSLRTTMDERPTRKALLQSKMLRRNHSETGGMDS